MENTNITKQIFGKVRMSKLIERLKKEEGLRLKSYRCTANKLTIGYGHNIDSYKDVVKEKYIKNGITQKQADKLLIQDIDRSEDELQQFFGLNFWDSLTDARQDALIEMNFNLGFTTFRTFKNTIAYILNKDFERASENILKSKWYEQLPKRVKIIAECIRTGEYAKGY